jgi:hypothetical protein
MENLKKSVDKSYETLEEEKSLEDTNRIPEKFDETSIKVKTQKKKARNWGHTFPLIFINDEPLIVIGPHCTLF